MLDGETYTFLGCTERYLQIKCGVHLHIQRPLDAMPHVEDRVVQ